MRLTTWERERTYWLTVLADMMADAVEESPLCVTTEEWKFYHTWWWDLYLAGRHDS